MVCAATMLSPCLHHPVLPIGEGRGLLVVAEEGVVEADAGNGGAQGDHHFGFRMGSEVDEVMEACTTRTWLTMNKTQRRHEGMEGTTLLLAARKPITRKAWRDMYPLRHPHLDALRNTVYSRPTMSLPNCSLTSHSLCCCKPELVGMTTPVLTESEDSVLALPVRHTVPLIGSRTPVEQVELFVK